MVASSCSRWSTDLAIFVSASCRMVSIPALSSTGRSAGAGSRPRPHQGPDLFAQYHALQVAILQEVEDHDRYVIVHAERESGVVHDFDAPVQDLHVVQAAQLGGVG